MVWLTDECSIILIAGSESPAKVSLIMYHLMVSPGKLQRLRGKLKTAMPDNSNIQPTAELEKLTYLAAVINERLRPHSGIVSRSKSMGREPLKFEEWTIPAGTPMSSSSYFTHYSESMFHVQANSSQNVGLKPKIKVKPSSGIWKHLDVEAEMASDIT